MKKLIATLAVIILTLSVAGCEGTAPATTEPSTEPTTQVTETTQPTTKFQTLEHLELKVDEIPYRSGWSDDLEKVGLERTDMRIRMKGYLTEDSKEQKVMQKVYLLRDFEKYNSRGLHDVFLAVVTDTKVLFEDVTGDQKYFIYDEELYLNDVDSDGTDEIIVFQHIDSCGGAGQHLAKIYKVENDDIKEIFCSDGFDEENTGFSGHSADNYTYIVTNSITGYYEEFKATKARHDLHDEDGKAVSLGSMNIDCFIKFFPKDIDSDGTCEIYCEQYTFSNGGHNYGTGTAVSILEYNTETQEFEVADAWFEPHF